MLLCDPKVDLSYQVQVTKRRELEKCYRANKIDGMEKIGEK